MAAGAFQFPSGAILDLVDGTNDLDTHSFTVCLFDSAWTPTATYSTTNELATANGYTQGGTATTVTPTESGGTLSVDASDVSWTASGGSITARYAAVRNSTSGTIVAYCLLDNTPADVTVTDGNTLTVTIGNIFTAS